MCDDMPTINCSRGIAGREYGSCGQLGAEVFLQSQRDGLGMANRARGDQTAKRSPGLRISSILPGRCFHQQLSPDRAVNNECCPFASPE